MHGCRARVPNMQEGWKRSTSWMVGGQLGDIDAARLREVACAERTGERTGFLPELQCERDPRGRVVALLAQNRSAPVLQRVDGFTLGHAFDFA